MNEVKWIKIVTDIFDDDKVKLIEAMPDGDTIIVIWFKLLCLAGKQNYHGLLLISDKLAYTDEMLSIVFRRPINTVRLALDAFEGFGMIQRTDIGAISITNWEKHQNADALDRIRENGRKRVAAHRERKALLAAQSDEKVDKECNVTETLPVTLCNAHVTPLDIDIDIEKDINNIPVPKELEKSNNNPVIKPDKQKRNKRQSVLSTEQKKLFDRFYASYPKKRSVADAEKAWSKIDPLPDSEFTDRAINVVRAKLSSGEWSKDRYQFIPYPATFLNEKGYLDDTDWSTQQSSPFKGNNTSAQKTKEELLNEYDEINRKTFEELMRKQYGDD